MPARTKDMIIATTIMYSFPKEVALAKAYLKHHPFPRESSGSSSKAEADKAKGEAEAKTKANGSKLLAIEDSKPLSKRSKLE